jgi:hypothetical protein
LAAVEVVEVVVEVVLAPHLAVVAEPLVRAVRAHLEAVVAPALVPVLPVRAHLAHLPYLPLLEAVVVPPVPVRAHLVLLALLRVVVVREAVEAVPVQLHLLSRQSFSAAMARNTP